VSEKEVLAEEEAEEGGRALARGRHFLDTS